jgi:hypothetical protein
MASDIKPCQSCGKLIFGGETVALSIADYMSLLKQSGGRNGLETRRKIPFGHRSRIRRDPELMRFIVERLDRMSQTDIIAACKAKFGPGRAPSRTGLSRFVNGL